MKQNESIEFNATLNPLELIRMRREAEAIAKQQGLTDPNDIDAFRHAYTSAQFADKYGESIATIAGNGNEWLREIIGRVKTLPNIIDDDPDTKWEGNPKDAWAMDVNNNSEGINKNSELDKLNLSPKEKEKRLRKELAEDVKNGKLQTKPSDTNQQYYDNEESNEDSAKKSTANSFTSSQNRTLDSGKRVASALAMEVMDGNVRTSDQKETHKNMTESIGRVLMDMDDSYDNLAVFNERPDLITDKNLHGRHADNEMVFKNIKVRVQNEMQAMQKSGNTEDAGETIKRAVVDNFGKIKFNQSTEDKENSMWKNTLSLNDDDVRN